LAYPAARRAADHPSSCEPTLQHPALLLAGCGEYPGTLALYGFHHIVIATCIVAIPPATFQSFGTGKNAHARVAQWHRLRQQPGGAWWTLRRFRVRKYIADHALPCAFRAWIVTGHQAINRVIAQAGTQTLAQMRPIPRLPRARVEQLARRRNAAPPL